MNDYNKSNFISPIHSHLEGLGQIHSIVPEVKYILSRCLYRWKHVGALCFSYKNNTLPYFFHRYNMTWRSERIIEIPIALQWLKTRPANHLLELGNTLGHYVKMNHTVCDQYEHGSHVINQDVLEYSPQEKFDSVLSLSTIEHIGFDEKPQTPLKALQALNHLFVQCLNTNGQMLCTWPFGYNPTLDQAVIDQKLNFSTVTFMKRVSKWNIWIQTDLEDIQNTRYNKDYPFANSLVIAEFNKSVSSKIPYEYT